MPLDSPHYPHKLIGHGKVMSYLDCDSPVGWKQPSWNLSITDGGLEQVWAGWLIGQATSAGCSGSWGSLQLRGIGRELKLLAPGGGDSLVIKDICQRLVHMDMLRGYQGNVLASVLSAPVMRGVVSAPCGAGKTRLCGAIVCGIMHRLAAGSGPALDEPSRWAYVVSNASLAAQTYYALMDSGHGRGHAGMWLMGAMWACLDGAGPAPEIHCFSPGEIWHRGHAGKRYEEFMSCQDGLLFDEVHRSAALGHAQCIIKSNAVVRIGLSATPLDRGDGLGGLVSGLFGPLLGSIGIKEVTDAGYLTPGKIRRA